MTPAGCQIHPRRRRLRLRHVLAVTIAATALGLPATATASLGVQSDLALMYEPDQFFARADALDAGWVRLMVPYNRWHDGESGVYVNAARAAHLSGRRVMVSLMSWKNYPTPAEWAAFARDVEPRLAPYVDAWSPMNEPNWPGMAPRTEVRCVPTSAPSVSPVTSTVRNGVRVERRFKRVRRGRGSHLRVRAHHRRWRFMRAHGRRQQRRASWRRTTIRVPLTGRRTVLVTTPGERSQCTTEAVAVAYRRVYDQVAPILAADRGATLVVGDLCPCGESTATFMDAFYSLGPVAVIPDILGIHPYSGAQAASAAVAYGRTRGLDVWATEWGARAPSTPVQWTTMLERFAEVGVRRTFLYDTGGGNDGWDTRIPADAVAPIRGM